jgi:putative autoinducer-2 (AI-2) aldolase
MDWGMKNRLSRIIKPETGRTVMLAIDHGYFLGPTSGLEEPGKTITPLLPYADTLMLTRGVLRTEIRPEQDIPIVLRVSGGSSIIGDDLSNEEITVSIEDAVRLNVSGVALSIFVGALYEKQTLQNLAILIDMAQDVGIPVLAVTAVGKDMMGANLVKTYYCEGFEEVVQSCPVPIVTAGGKKVPEADALQMAFNAVQGGAVGVDMGRNIFQSESPVAMIQAVRKVVHEKATPQEAFAFFEETKKDYM